MNSKVGTKNPIKFWKSAEELEVAEEGHVVGSIPLWLKGVYLRTGPGFFDFDDGFTMNHWLDGYAVVSKFEIKDGKANFSKKFLNSSSFKRAKAAQRPAVCEFGTRGYSEPGKSFFSKIIPNLAPELTDNCNMSLFQIGKEVFCSGETSFFHEYNIKTMNSIHTFDTNKCFSVNAASAHPLTDETGTYNIGNSLMTGLRYHFIRIPPPNGKKLTGKELINSGKIIGSISSRWSTIMSYNHSFGLTKNYMILIEQPFVLNVKQIIGSVLTRNQSFSDWLEWMPETRPNDQCLCRFIVINKFTGKLANQKIEFFSDKPFFFLHVINCYEEDGQIVVDLNVFDDPLTLKTTDLTQLRGGFRDVENTRALGQRFVIPINVVSSDVPEGTNFVTLNTSATAMKKGKQMILSPEILAKKGLEMPSINLEFVGKKYRFYYATGLNCEGFFKSSICKVDIRRKEPLMWREDENYVLGEPIFVPDPTISRANKENEEEKEDAGVLIVPCTDEREEERDFILFLKADEMSELGRVYFNSMIPPSLHGVFIDNS